MGDPAVDLDDPEALVERAWSQIYLDGQRAGELGARAVEMTAQDPHHPSRGMAWFHVAYAHVRAGRHDAGLEANARARACFAARGDRRGLLLCDEVDALHLSLAERLDEAMRLHEAIAAQGDVERPPIDRYISHNSRGLTRKRLGHTDETLLDLYRALDAAKQVNSPGAHINALCNLGGIHADLFNLPDARALCEQALEAGAQAGAWVAFGIAALNLMQVHDGLGLAREGLRTAERLLEQRQRLPPGLICAPSIALAHCNAGDLEQAQRWLDAGPNAPFGEGDGKTEWARVQSRVHLARGDIAAARRVAVQRLDECRAGDITDPPYSRLKLLHAAADACEAAGDTGDALRHLRQAQALYESMVGRSAQARFIAIQAEHQFVQAQRERDLAQRAHEAAELDRQRLAALNTALEAKMAEAQALEAQLREQALCDPLTGLHNRRYLHEVAPSWLNLARRQGEAVSLVVLDIDHFKRLNDSHGHDAGDAMLQHFARMLLGRLRSSDMICRFGGEEFVVLIGADAAGARKVLEALIEECRAIRIDTASGAASGYAFSAGVATCPGDGDHLDVLMKAADVRLYRAKALGRARVCTE